MSVRKSPEDLRSHRWLGVNDLRAFGHRSRLRQGGFDAADFRGKAGVGIPARVGAPDAGPVASRPLESLTIPNSKCPEIPQDSTGAPPDGVVKGRVVQQETGRPLSGAHLQMVGQTYHTFADDDGNFELHFDLNLMADCRVQYVTIIAPGYGSQMLPIVMGGGISTVPLRRR